ncbi:MAG: efflux RND transporter periplasmic adaptor subunit [Gammaproteobacteria bacterium]|nr:efflux RND transporter periplasmic adaptor subunit [Gammaproteobacteria bacterium]
MTDIIRPRLILSTLAVAGLLGAVTAGLVVANPRPATVAAAAAALPVETVALTLQDGYTVRREFSGRVQAARASDVGFEIPGRLARVLVDEGMSVEAGQLLAELDRERLAAQRAERVAALAEAEARLALAEVTLRRLQGVVDQGGVSRQGLDEAREARRAGAAARALAAQRVDSIDVELAKTRLLAPFAATVVARSADEGRVLASGQAVLTLQERDSPEIRIGVAGLALDRLVAGQRYTLAWRDRPIAARLRALLPQRAATARTVDALFDPVAPPAGMLPGDLVTLTLDSRVAQRGAWLPLGALAEGRRGLWSALVIESLDLPDDALAATHRVVRRTVDVVHHDDERVFVRGALRDDERIVTTGLQRIVPGQLVRLAAAPVVVAESRHD